MQSRYVLAVDGLRAVAVLLVVMFHTGVFAAGWVGVWIFYVISGFVITAALMSREGSSRSLGASLRDFYGRRFYRIVPLYGLAVVGGSVVNAVAGILHGQDLIQLLTLSTFTFNFLRMWSDFAPSSMTSHLWSVSVEEQFYFIFPLLFLMLSRRTLLVVLSAVLGACVLLRWGVSVVVAGAVPENAAISPGAFKGSIIYHLSILHFDAFAAGALIALTRNYITRPARLFTVLAACTLIGWALFFLNCGRDLAFGSPLSTLKIFAYGGGVEVVLYSLLILSAAVLIIGILRRAPFVLIPLSVPPLVYLGKISYGIYIFHFPIVFMLTSMGLVASVRDLQTALVLLVTTLALTIAVATLSFYWFERPVQKLWSDRR